MLDTDDLALWYAFNRLIVNYWADVSAKLITMNMKSSTATIQARFRSLAHIGPALHPPAVVLVQFEG